MGAISYNYAKTVDTKEEEEVDEPGLSLLTNKIKESFDRLLQNKELVEFEGTKTIKSWYEEQSKTHEEQPQKPLLPRESQEQQQHKHQTLLKIVNKIGVEMVKQIVPYYTNSVIGNIGFKTQFKEVTLTDIEVGLLDTHIDPFTEFAKLVNGVKVSAVKIKFHLELITRIEKVTIKKMKDRDVSIDLDNIEIKLKLSLTGIELSSLQVPTPFSTLKQPIQIGSDKLEIEHITFHRKLDKDQATIAKDVRNLTSEQKVKTTEDYKVNESSICINCKNRNPATSNFCNKCGSKINLEAELYTQ